MRILHATKRYPNSTGGDGIVVSNLQRYQERSGHEVFVMTSNCPDIVDGPRVTKFGPPIVSADLDVINARRIVTLLGMLCYAFWFLRRVKPDIIHTHCPDFAFALSFAARLYRIPTINTCHGVSFNDSSFSAAKRHLEVFLLRSARHRLIITVDAAALPDFDAIGLGPVVYHPNAVEPDGFLPCRPAPEGRVRMLYVGRLAPVKGIPILLKAFREVLLRNPNVELQLAGPGRELDDYRGLATQLGVSHRVTFLGRRCPEELAELYASSDIFVLPSLYEGFALVILEAWASSLPVVVTRVGNVPEVCVDESDALVVPPGDPAALAAALERLVKDGELRDWLGRRGRDKIETTYNYAATSRLLERVYSEVTS